MRSRLRDRTWIFGSIVESADRVSKAGLGKGSEDVLSCGVFVARGGSRVNYYIQPSASVTAAFMCC